MAAKVTPTQQLARDLATKLGELSPQGAGRDMVVKAIKNQLDWWVLIGRITVKEEAK